MRSANPKQGGATPCVDATIAAKLPGQLKAFLGRISPRFRKPVARFIGDMMYGIMAEKEREASLFEVFGLNTG